MLLALAGITIQSYYSRKWRKQRALLEKQTAVGHERTRIATDMHDDLGSGLSRIRFLSETIDFKKKRNEPIEEDIGKIRLYAHEMIDKMGEIVWALNQKNDSLQDLFAYTRSYAAEYLLQNNIECAATIPEIIPDMILSGEVRRNIFLAVKESLHNVVQHANATRVVLNIACAGKLVIIIRDNGKGFDETKVNNTRNGLYNMRKRIADIKGAMEININNGTQVQFSIPLPL